MRREIPHPQALACFTFAAALLASTAQAFDGTESLGPPVGLAPVVANDMVVAGTGMPGGVGVIHVTIPSGVTIRQVLAYWEGQAFTEAEHGANDDLWFGPHKVTGSRIGGPTLFFTSWAGEAWSSTYRADLTALGLVSTGPNSIAVGGMNFGHRNNGVSLVVLLDDGTSSADYAIRDGNDLAYWNFGDALTQTGRVRFDFAAAGAARSAKLCHVLGSVADMRPTVIEVWIDGAASVRFNDVLGNLDGAEWDSLMQTITIPAGATWLEVQIRSEDSGIGRFAGRNPASLAWVFSSLVLPSAADDGCAARYWYDNKSSWPAPYLGTTKDATTLGTAFGFGSGMPFFYKDLHKKKMVEFLKKGDKTDKVKECVDTLMKEAVAALLNASSPQIAYPLTADQVKLQVLVALLAAHNDAGQLQLVCDLAAYFRGLNDNDCPGNANRCVGGILELGLVTEVSGFGGFPALVLASALSGTTPIGSTDVSYDHSSPPVFPITDDGIVFIDDIQVVSGALRVSMRVLATGTSKGKLPANTTFVVKANGIGNSEVIHTSCSIPIGVDMWFGTFKITMLKPRG